MRLALHVMVARIKCHIHCVVKRPYENHEAIYIWSSARLYQLKCSCGRPFYPPFDVEYYNRKKLDWTYPPENKQ